MDFELGIMWTTCTVLPHLATKRSLDSVVPLHQLENRLHSATKREGKRQCNNNARVKE